MEINFMLILREIFNPPTTLYSEIPENKKFIDKYKSHHYF